MATEVFADLTDSNSSLMPKVQSILVTFLAVFPALKVLVIQLYKNFMVAKTEKGPKRSSNCKDSPYTEHYAMGVSPISQELQDINFQTNTTGFQSHDNKFAVDISHKGTTAFSLFASAKSPL